MAEIQVERKPKSGAGWLLGLLLLIAVLGAGWYFTMGPGAGTGPLDEGPDLAPPASMPGRQAPAQTPPAPGTPATGTAPAPQRAP
jgi:hypothetical protein